MLSLHLRLASASRHSLRVFTKSAAPIAGHQGNRGFASAAVPDLKHEDMFFKTNDNVQLRYTDSGGSGAPLVFLHGWTANGRYFDKNVEFLSKNGLRVVTMDYRGMGESEHCKHGARVARIATDVKCLVDHLSLENAVFCGTSMGYTVISYYYELFGTYGLTGAVFVDQTAAQYIKPGWELGSLGLCTREMCADLQGQLRYNKDELARGIASGGFGKKPPTEEEYAWFKKQYLKCDLEFCGRLMEDHANLDFRDLIPTMRLPILNLIGGSSKCHQIAGMTYIGDHAPNAKNVIYEDFGHFLYWEDPERFNQDVLRFVQYVDDPDSNPPMKDF